MPWTRNVLFRDAPGRLPSTKDDFRRLGFAWSKTTCQGGVRVVVVCRLTVYTHLKGLTCLVTAHVVAVLEYRNGGRVSGAV
jgi:hypothetical protein